MRRYALLLSLLIVVAGLAGCNEEKPASQAAPQAPKAIAKPPTAQAPSPGDQPADAMTETKFVYLAEGRRDPFMRSSPSRKATLGREFENPLEAYDLVQYQLKGVVVGFGEPKAMVVAPDGKTYILRKGAHRQEQWRYPRNHP